MRKTIRDYRRKIDCILQQEEDCSWEGLREEHLARIAFFQHERLAHLIVTALFALLELISVALAVLSFSAALLFLCAAFLVLLIPYICHYYCLENEVQRLYAQYDRINEKCRGAGEA
jgi:hypothetical protein